MGEPVWKDVVGWEGVYQVSNYGEIKSLHYNKERIMKQSTDTNGYLQVKLNKNGNGKAYLVHRLVAQAFIPNYHNKPFINHLDSNPKNNKITNLEWCTQSENVRHAIGVGNHFIPKGSNNPTAIINEEIAAQVKRELATGKKPKQVSDELNVNYYIVKDIKRGRTWREVEI